MLDKVLVESNDIDLGIPYAEAHLCNKMMHLLNAIIESNNQNRIEAALRKLEQMQAPEVLKILVQSGFISSFEADLAKDAVDLKQALGKIQTFRQYPTGRNGQNDASPVSQNNLNPERQSS